MWRRGFILVAGLLASFGIAEQVQEPSTSRTKTFDAWELEQCCLASPRSRWEIELRLLGPRLGCEDCMENGEPLGNLVVPGLEGAHPRWPTIESRASATCSIVALHEFAFLTARHCPNAGQMVWGRNAEGSPLIWDCTSPSEKGGYGNPDVAVCWRAQSPGLAGAKAALISVDAADVAEGVEVVITSGGGKGGKLGYVPQGGVGWLLSPPGSLDEARWDVLSLARACRGDSGGGVFRAVQGELRLVGVLSSGPDCGRGHRFMLGVSRMAALAGPATRSFLECWEREHSSIDIQGVNSAAEDVDCSELPESLVRPP